MDVVWPGKVSTHQGPALSRGGLCSTHLVDKMARERGILKSGTEQGVAVVPIAAISKAGQQSARPHRLARLQASRFRVSDFRCRF